VDLIPSLGGRSVAGAAPGAAVSVAGRQLDLEGLTGAAGTVASRVAGMKAVAVEASASLETVVAVVGGLLAGVPVVPLPADAGPLERGHILSDSAAEAVLVAAGSVPGAPVSVGGPATIPVDVSERSEPPRVSLATERDAMILYTSGTTGLPKGVVLGAAAIATDLDLLAEAWEWTADDVLVHGLPLFHVHGLVLGVIGALRVGSPLVHTGRPTPGGYAEAAAGGSGSLFFGVPTVWSRIADDEAAAKALRGGRLLVSGSAGLPVPVFERLQGLCGQGPIERYGMTETLITVSGTATGQRRPGWVGRALRGVNTRLRHEDGSLVPADGEALGELEVLTPTVTRGYLNRPDADAELFGDDGWVRTGDVASIDTDGWHRVVGRKSTDLIKTGGYRVGAGEVEAALLAHPAVRECAVVGEPDPDLGQIIVAYVIAEGTGSKELTDFVASTLSVHKRPRRVEFLDDLPRNAMGKVQKKLLPGGGG
jgi:fatty acid CoA ligase FadD36